MRTTAWTRSRSTTLWFGAVGERRAPTWAATSTSTSISCLLVSQSIDTAIEYVQDRLRDDTWCTWKPLPLSDSSWPSSFYPNWVARVGGTSRSAGA